jgi:hypothetical protein
MASKRITHTVGNVVVIKKKHWREFLHRVQQGGSDPALMGRGGCDSYCESACEDNDGCDFSFGSPGECGAACNDGEVYLEI